MSFFNIMLCCHFSLETVLQGMAKSNPTKQQIDAKIQAHWKMHQLEEEEM